MADPNITMTALLRSSAKSEAFLRSKHASQCSSGQLSFIEVPDMTTPGAFDEPASRANAIMHIATPLATEDWMKRLVKAKLAYCAKCPERG